MSKNVENPRNIFGAFRFTNSLNIGQLIDSFNISSELNFLKFESQRFKFEKIIISLVISQISPGIIGSTTALIAILREDELRIANLGDSTIIIIRGKDCIFRSEILQHSFNFPKQLGTGSFDTPQDAQSYKIKIQKGDIVILGSDGLFDNVFEDDLLDEISRFICPKKGIINARPQVISDAITCRAKNASEDLNTPSPFSSQAMEEGLYYQGGKNDDISVVVGIISNPKELNTYR
ncbi:hypothetical protein Glove_712g12 [Diversispora epigaea]|uniref:Protein phosphatase n=1 Tax=Diversispora epigaea TaxID=1348612 RepID=A0A397G498_9GLOM|nr:hypothetical protein Glove_712g12 [Diversispora epigaea]